MIDVVNNELLRTLDARTIRRHDGVTWRALPATPYPAEAPGDDVCAFATDGPLKDKHTDERHIRWLPDGLSPAWSVEDGCVGFASVGASVARRALIDCGFDATTPHIVKFTIGPDPGSGAGNTYETGVIVCAEGAASSDDCIVYQFSEGFGNLHIINHQPAGTSIGTRLGTAVSEGSVLQVEVGTDPGSGATYVFVHTHTGGRVGPFAIPAGTFAANTMVGVWGSDGIAHRLIAGWEVFEGSIIHEAPLSSSLFTGAAAELNAYADDQGHTFGRSNAVFDLNGSGQVYANVATGLANSIVGFVDVRYRDVEVKADVATGTGAGIAASVMACFPSASQQNDFLAADILQTGTINLRKRVASTNTILASDAGHTAGDTTHRELRMVINWPDVDVYYDGAVTPDISYTLTPTDQSDLGGGTRTRVGFGVTKQNAVASPTINSWECTVATAPEDFADYVTEIDLGADNYSGNTYCAPAYGPIITSDGTKQIVGTPELDGGDIYWGYKIRDLPAGAFGSRVLLTDLGIVPDDDNHNACAYAFDGDGRILACGNHHAEPLKMVIGGTAYSSSFTLVDTADMGGVIDTPDTWITYPQFLPLPSGDVLFTCRRGVPALSDQLLYRWNYATADWTPLGPDDDGLLINGTHGNPTHDRGVYLTGNGGMVRSPISGDIHMAWTWCREVDPEDAEGPLNTLYHDVCHIFSDDDGVTWRKHVTTTAFGMPLDVLDDNITALETGGGPPDPVGVGLENIPTIFIDDNDQPNVLTWITSDPPTWKHLVWDGSGVWNAPLDADVDWNKRSAAGFAYDGRTFAIARPTGSNGAWLYELTPGSGDYGTRLARLHQGIVTTGWHANYDANRLVAEGIISLLVTPSAGAGIGGGYDAVQAYVIDFDVAQFIDDGF